MKKNKISRKDFIKKTSKVAGGLVFCPTILVMLQGCDDNSVSSADSCADTNNNLIATCSSGHGGQFDTNGCPISGPPTESLQSYNWEFNENNNTLLIEESLEVNLSNLDVGLVLTLSGNEVDDINTAGLFVHRKSKTGFNVLSRTCPHQAFSINSFQ